MGGDSLLSAGEDACAPMSGVPPAESNEEQERCKEDIINSLYMVRDELRRHPKTLGARASRPHLL